MLNAFLMQMRDTALIMGIIALVGLLLQKKSAVDTFAGTVKTIIGFMIFNIGSSAMSAQITTFGAMFSTAFILHRLQRAGRRDAGRGCYLSRA